MRSGTAAKEERETFVIDDDDEAEKGTGGGGGGGVAKNVALLVRSTMSAAGGSTRSEEIHHSDYEGLQQNDDGDEAEARVEGGEEEEVFDNEVVPAMEEDGEEDQQTTTSRLSRILRRIFLTCILPDDTATFCGMKVVDGPPAVKLFKFVFLTLIGITFMHWLVRKMDLEHREQFTLDKFWMYESSMVVIDALFFFTVARLWRPERQGVDHLAWILTALAANLYCSVLNTFRFLQQSVTLYNMHCTWSWKLWLFAMILIPLVVAIILLHVNYAVQRRLFLMKFLELVLATVFLLLPYISSPYLHLHHWFAGWIIGMHCNFDAWWSRATLAWCWGLYINGIAVYGRDPVLTCGYSLFLSKQQGCPYLDCYLVGIAHPNNNDTSVPHVKEMKTPDWRNCSADAYHP